MIECRGFGARLVLVIVLGLPITSPSISHAQGDVFFEKRTPNNADERLLLSINHWGDPGLDGVMKAASNTAGPILVAASLGLYGGGIISHDREASLNGVTAGISIAASSGLTLLLKEIVQRDRPYKTLTDVRTPNGPEGSYSFPSGHATAAAALATSLSLAYPRWEVIVPSVLYATLVAYSRMYVGVHYPTDVLAGALIGVGVSYLVYEVRDEIGTLINPLLPRNSSSQSTITPITSRGLGISYTMQF